MRPNVICPDDGVAVIGWSSKLAVAASHVGQVAPAAGWQPEEALSCLMLHTLTQTPTGQVWAGTDEGVYRFDGTQSGRAAFIWGS